MKERLRESPQDKQDRQSALALRNLFLLKDEDLRNRWQDRTFAFEFPALAVYLISSKGRAEFSEDQRADLFSLSLRTFLNNNNKGLTGCAFTADGSIVNRDNQGNLVLQIASDNQPKLLSQDEKTESFTKALTASILLIGMSLKDREKQRSLLIESYQELSKSKKSSFTENLRRLLAKNNPVRIWIKDNRLDADNGFDWDMELSQLLFFSIYAFRIEHLPMPQEMRPDPLKNCSLQTRSVMLNFALKYAEHLNKGISGAKLTEFIMKMDAMEMAGDMREKLDLLKQKVEFKVTTFLGDR